jgi:hypothetical protein
MACVRHRRLLTQFILAAVAMLADWGTIQAEGFGPFPVRNFQPFQLPVLGMPSDRAQVLKKGTVDVRMELANTSAIFKEETNPPFFALTRATVKFETLRSGLYLRYGFTDRLEVRLEIPALYRYEGIMEGAITATERAFAEMTRARAALRQTGFAFNVSRDGRTFFSGGDRALGLGDMTVLGKYQVLVENDRLPAVALRFALKAPTGDEGRFFGSGHPDVGVGIAVEKAVLPRWILYGNANGVFPTGTVSGLTLHPVFSAVAAVEYLWTPSLSFVAQFDYYSSTYRNTGFKLLDRGVTEIAAGFNYRLRHNVLWQVYGVENVDVITGGAADFTLSTVLTYRFSR